MTEELLPTRQPDRGLGRRQRITRSKTFEEMFAGGRRAVGRLMVMFVRKAAGSWTRLGVTAGRKSIPRAVDRSRAKRLLREAFRLNRHRLAEGYDIVLVARRGLVDATRQEVEAELLRLAERLEIWQEKERRVDT